MSTNVHQNAADAVTVADKRVQTTLNQLRKVANIRTWALSDADKARYVEAISRANEAMAGLLLGTGESASPFKLG